MLCSCDAQLLPLDLDSKHCGFILSMKSQLHVLYTQCQHYSSSQILRALNLGSTQGHLKVFCEILPNPKREQRVLLSNAPKPKFDRDLPHLAPRCYGSVRRAQHSRATSSDSSGQPLQAEPLAGRTLHRICCCSSVWHWTYP